MKKKVTILSPGNVHFFFFFNMKSPEEPGSAPMVYLTLTPPLQLFNAGDAEKKKPNMSYMSCLNAVSEGL